jgi:hypothetical protein
LAHSRWLCRDARVVGHCSRFCFIVTSLALHVRFEFIIL